MTKPLNLDDFSRMYPRDNPKDRSIDRVDYFGSANTITTEEGVTISISEGCTCGPDDSCLSCPDMKFTTVNEVPKIAKVEIGEWLKRTQEEAGLYPKRQPAEQSGAMREKRDAIPYDLVPFQEITEAYARVAEFGARKYAAWNWSLGLKRVQLCGSLLRHVFAYIRGEDRDKESGLLHTDHILWNAAALSHNVHWNLEDGRRGEPARAYKEG